jgi:hypothetical protein
VCKKVADGPSHRRHDVQCFEDDEGAVTRNVLQIIKARVGKKAVMVFDF